MLFCLPCYSHSRPPALQLSSALAAVTTIDDVLSYATAAAACCTLLVPAVSASLATCTDRCSAHTHFLDTCLNQCMLADAELLKTLTKCGRVRLRL